MPGKGKYKQSRWAQVGKVCRK